MKELLIQLYYCLLPHKGLLGRVNQYQLRQEAKTVLATSYSATAYQHTINE